MTIRENHVLYVISQVQKSLAFEWIASNLAKKYKLTFVLLNSSESPLEQFLKENNITVKRIKYCGKKNFLSAFIKLLQYFFRVRPSVVHAHLLDAQLLGLTTAWLAAVPKRIYTRHNSDYHHRYFRKGVKYDLLSNLLSTHIISISQATFKTLVDLESVSQKKIRSIHHGFDIKTFEQPDPLRIEHLKSKWCIELSYPCVGVIARHIEWKGIQYIIPAFKKLLQQFPSALLIMANAHGPYEQDVKKALLEIPVKNYKLIPFEEDVPSLYAIFDVYVHTPIDDVCEAFGQTYVEALIAGIPSVFTRSGIAAEFIEHKVNAWVVDFQNSDQIYEGMVTLIKDANLRRSIVQNGHTSVRHKFELAVMIDKLESLYDE